MRRGLFSLENKWLFGGPSSSPRHLWGGNKKDRGRLFEVVHGKRMRNNSDELRQGKFQLGTKKKIHCEDN